MPRLALRPLVLTAVLALMAVIVGPRPRLPSPKIRRPQRSLSICLSVGIWLVPRSTTRSP